MSDLSASGVELPDLDLLKKFAEIFFLTDFLTVRNLVKENLCF